MLERTCRVGKSDVEDLQSFRGVFEVIVDLGYGKDGYYYIVYTNRGSQFWLSEKDGWFRVGQVKTFTDTFDGPSGVEKTCVK